MIKKESFGKTKNGEQATLYTLQNKDGVKVKISDYGATLVSFIIPRLCGGEELDIVLGFDSVEEYDRPENPYFGATCGRFCNRIAGGEFELDGKIFKVAKNDGENHLHGGNERALSRVMWEFVDGYDHELKLRYKSPDGEEGYPGNLDIQANFMLTNNSELYIEYCAKTDRKTIVNLTNHAYWNINGHDSGSVLDHELLIPAMRYTPTDDESIPTGELARVEDTPFDFRKSKKVGQDIAELEKTAACGYDHNYVICNHKGMCSSLHADLYSPESRMRLEISSDQPGVQLYTGNFLEGIQGKGGAVYNKNAGLCLETQLFPDGIHHENFVSPVLEAGEHYRSITRIEFTL